MNKQVITSIPECNYWFSKFNFNLFSLDTETDNTLRYDELKLGFMQLYDGTNCYLIDMHVPGMINFIKTYFDSFINVATNNVACHNITFDMKVLNKFGINLENCFWLDSVILSHLIDENRLNNKLKTLASELLGYDVTTFKELEGEQTVHNKQFVEYSMMDAVYTYELVQYFRPLIKEQGLEKLYVEIEEPFLKALTQIEINGILVDQERIADTTKDLIKEKTKLELEMYKVLDIKVEMQCNLLTGEIVPISNINFNSSHDLSKILYEKLGLEIKEVSKKTGKASTGKLAINRLRKENEFVNMLSRYRIIQKLLSSFFEPLPGFIQSDGRIRPNYRDVGTVTGRLACNSPNIQQLPKQNKEFPVDTRSCFIVPEGKKIITCDYSQQELRITAELSKDENLINILLNDGDLHLINANNVFQLGIPSEKLLTSHPEYEDIKTKYKKDRDKGKVFSFGVLYGMSEHKLSRDFNVTIEDAKIMLENYFSGFPSLRVAIDKCHADAENDLYVTTMYGRRRHFTINQWGKLDDKSLRQSFNFLIQSVGADLIRKAIIKVYDYSKKFPQFGVKLIMTVHDELSVECNEDVVEDVLQDVKDIMESCAKFVVPLLADGSYGSSYGDTK